MRPAVPFRASSLWHVLQRAFLGMRVHETGHALSAWQYGDFAAPFVWKTSMRDDTGS